MKTLSIYIQQYFTNYIKVVTNPNTGGFNDSTPPITPDEFEKRLMEEALGPDFMHGQMDAAEIRQIQAAKVIYTYAYGDFVKLPLNGDAPPAVVSWQAEARKG